MQTTFTVRFLCARIFQNDRHRTRVRFSGTISQRRYPHPYCYL